MSSILFVVSLLVSVWSGISDKGSFGVDTDTKTQNTDSFYGSNHHACGEQNQFLSHEADLDLPSLHMQDVTFAEDFASQMNAITFEFPSKFSKIKVLRKDGAFNGPRVRYYSGVSMTGSVDYYFEDDTLAGTTTYYARFPGSTVYAYALSSYTSIIASIESLSLSCCYLSKEEEKTQGTQHSQIFSVIDPNYKTDETYRNMIIEVRLELGQKVGSTGNEIPTYIPMVVIYSR